MLKYFFQNFFFLKSDIGYFANYLVFWKTVVYVRKRAHLLTLYSLISLSLLMALKYVLIELLNPCTTIRILLYDSFNLVLPNQAGLSAMIAECLLMTAYLLHLAYFKGEPRSFLDLENILFEENPRSLLRSSYKGQSACQYIITFANRLLKLNQVVLLLIGMRLISQKNSVIKLIFYFLKCYF